MNTTVGRTRAGRRKGIFLIELLGYLVIMAAVAVVVGDLINLLMKTMRSTAERDTMIARVDSAMDQLRRDTWGAQAIRPGADGVEIVQPGGSVTWKSLDGVLTRTDGGTPRVWVGMPPMTFSNKGAAVLVLQINSGPGAAQKEEITFVSQRMMAGGAR